MAPSTRSGLGRGSESGNRAGDAGVSGIKDPMFIIEVPKERLPFLQLA